MHVAARGDKASCYTMGGHERMLRAFNIGFLEIKLFFVIYKSWYGVNLENSCLVVDLSEKSEK